MIARLAAAATLLALGLPAAAADRLAVRALWLEVQQDRPPVLSNLDPVPEDLGLAGARLGLADNAAGGKFLGHDFALEEVIVPSGEDPSAALEGAAARADLILLRAPAEVLLRMADLAPDALIFNTAAREDALRRADCRANVLHSTPSRAMLADALAQFLVQKRWTDWMLIEGPHPGDMAFAEALRRSAAKFGAKIRDEKTWTFDADMRRSAAAEVPVFTQGPDVDVYLVADEAEDWGRYVLYNTWTPRPVAGTEGITPQAWSPAVESWGAAQLQSRFEDLAGRGMQADDYAAWAALRSIGEAVTRTGKADAASLRAYILSSAFELGGFKGRKMSYRAWNGQLRQPIPLVHPRAVAAQAPLEGFLHRENEMDTLGYDAPEAGCTAFAAP